MLHSLGCGENREARDSSRSQHCHGHVKGQGVGLPALQPRMSASPPGNSKCRQRQLWMRMAWREEMGEDGTVPCWFAESGKERALGKGCVGLFWPWDLRNTVSVWTLLRHVWCRGRSPQPQPSDLETPTLSAHEHNQLFLVLSHSHLLFLGTSLCPAAEGVQPSAVKSSPSLHSIKPIPRSPRKSMALTVVSQAFPSLNSEIKHSYREN